MEVPSYPNREICEHRKVDRVLLVLVAQTTAAGVDCGDKTYSHHSTNWATCLGLFYTPVCATVG